MRPCPVFRHLVLETQYTVIPMKGMTCAYHSVLAVGSGSFKWFSGLYDGPHRARICPYVMFTGPAIPEIRMLMK